MCNQLHRGLTTEKRDLGENIPSIFNRLSIKVHVIDPQPVHLPLKGQEAAQGHGLDAPQEA